MIKVDSVWSDSITTPDPDEFNFLNLSGRNAYYTQGYFGYDVIVAVLDTGVSPHPEFGDRVLQGKNFCREYSPSWGSNDDNGHGTHVAGTIAGSTCGIAPQARILPVKVLNGMGEGRIDSLIEALKWVKEWRSPENRRVDIVNLSLSSSASSLSSELYRIYEDTINALVHSGVAVIAASGNTGQEDKLIPAYFQEVISVGAVDVQKKTAYFSTRSDQVDVCQVGVDILSAWFKGGYARMTGTSMATPMVCGIAALLASKYKATRKVPNMPEPSLYDALKMNTVDVGAVGVDKETGAGFCTLNPMPEVVMKFKRNDPVVLVNGETIVSDIAPQLIGDRMVIPLRLCAEGFGASVSWDSSTDTATVVL